VAVAAADLAPATKGGKGMSTGNGNCRLGRPQLMLDIHIARDSGNTDNLSCLATRSFVPPGSVAADRNTACNPPIKVGLDPT